MQPEDVAAEIRNRLADQERRAAELRAIADLLPTLVRDWTQLFRARAALASALRPVRAAVAA